MTEKVDLGGGIFEYRFKDEKWGELYIEYRNINNKDYITNVTLVVDPDDEQELALSISVFAPKTFLRLIDLSLDEGLSLIDRQDWKPYLHVKKSNVMIPGDYELTSKMRKELLSYLISRADLAVPGIRKMSLAAGL